MCHGNECRDWVVSVKRKAKSQLNSNEQVENAQSTEVSGCTVTVPGNCKVWGFPRKACENLSMLEKQNCSEMAKYMNG